MRTAPTSDLWWKNAVVYCLDVETFVDTDGDGCGDLGGLVDRIDHVGRARAPRACGYAALPHAEPRRRLRHHRLPRRRPAPRGPRRRRRGDPPRRRPRAARARRPRRQPHLRRAPWFRAARADRSSPYRDYYVWTDDPRHEEGTTSEDNWTWDDEAGQYYMHRFAPFQPDLNIANPAVRDEIAKTVGFWLKLGVSGFRMDAVPFLRRGGRRRATRRPATGKRWLHALREYALRRRGDAMLMGEVNVAMEDIAVLLRGPRRRAAPPARLPHQPAPVAVARPRRAAPLEDLIRELPVPPHDCGWATFLRNHDELTLDKLSDAERDEVFAAFAPEEDMRIYGHGIRRRAASMLGGDGPRLRMAWSLLLSLPGTPVILYGDEIGMGEDLALDGPHEPCARRCSGRPARRRVLVRAGGAARAPGPRGRFGPEAVNVVGAAARPRLAAAVVTRLVHARRDDARARPGHEPAARERAAGGVRPPLRLGGLDRLRGPQPADEPATVELDLGDDVTGVDDLLELREHDVRGGRLRRGARRLRVPVAARAAVNTSRRAWLMWSLGVAAYCVAVFQRASLGVAGPRRRTASARSAAVLSLFIVLQLARLRGAAGAGRRGARPRRLAAHDRRRRGRQMAVGQVVLAESHSVGLAVLGARARRRRRRDDVHQRAAARRGLVPAAARPGRSPSSPGCSARSGSSPRRSRSSPCCTRRGLDDGVPGGGRRRPGRRRPRRVRAARRAAGAPRPRAADRPREVRDQLRDGVARARAPGSGCGRTSRRSSPAPCSRCCGAIRSSCRARAARPARPARCSRCSSRRDGRRAGPRRASAGRWPLRRSVPTLGGRRRQRAGLDRRAARGPGPRRSRCSSCSCSCSPRTGPAR